MKDTVAKKLMRNICNEIGRRFPETIAEFEDFASPRSFFLRNHYAHMEVFNVSKSDRDALRSFVYSIIIKEFYPNEMSLSVLMLTPEETQEYFRQDFDYLINKRKAVVAEWEIQDEQGKTLNETNQAVSESQYLAEKQQNNSSVLADFPFSVEETAKKFFINIIGKQKGKIETAFWHSDEEDNYSFTEEEDKIDDGIGINYTIVLDQDAERQPAVIIENKRYFNLIKIASPLDRVKYLNYLRDLFQNLPICIFPKPADIIHPQSCQTQILPLINLLRQGDWKASKRRKKTPEKISFVGYSPRLPFLQSSKC
jgi:hypothetical protein